MTSHLFFALFMDYVLKNIFVLCLFFSLSGCHFMEKKINEPVSIKTRSFSPYRVVFLVSSRNLDYRNTRSFIISMLKHPERGDRGISFGHAWFYLEGLDEDGQRLVMEGGHSAERQGRQPPYFEGVMNLIEYGVLEPTGYQKKHPQRAFNPISYLWAKRYDAYFQEGSGGYEPSFALSVDLSEDLFHQLKDMVENYDYSTYCLRDKQCCSLIVQMAKSCGIILDDKVELSIDPFLDLGSLRLPFWKDAFYSRLVFSSPDVLEKSLRKAAKEGVGKDVLSWYLSKSYRPPYRGFIKVFLPLKGPLKSLNYLKILKKNPLERFLNQYS